MGFRRATTFSLQLLPVAFGLLQLLQMEFGTAVAAANSPSTDLPTQPRLPNIPKELMNPVTRSLFRQRLMMLKLQSEALRRRQANEASKLALEDQPNGSMPLKPNNRNCFFSPIQCQLPVIGLRQRSIKRRIVGAYMSRDIEEYERSREEEQEKDEEEKLQQQRRRRQKQPPRSRIGQYLLMATTAARQQQQQQQKRHRQQKDEEGEFNERRRRGGGEEERINNLGQF